MNRREFTKGLLGTLASYSLLETLVSRDLLADSIKPVVGHWVGGLHEMSRDLKTGTIAPAVWQAKVKELFDRVELSEMLRFIDFDKLIAGFEHPDLGVNTKQVPFPKLDGIPEDLAFHRKIFGMKKDRAIIPHGHKNMVSCHYVLQGEFHLRHYEKIEETESHMVIEPTIDQIAKVGSHSSISDEKNNIHWLKANTETAFTFDVLVVDLKDAKWDVDNIDPYGAEKIGESRLRVRKLALEEALAKYGHDMHH